MESAKYLSLGLTAFSLAMLLAQSAIAYPFIRLGAVLLLFALALFAVLSMGMGGLFVAMRARGSYLRKSDGAIALVPAGFILVLVVVAVLFGVYLGT